MLASDTRNSGNIARSISGEHRCAITTSIKDIIEYNRRTGGLSRREFGALTLGAGLVSALPAGRQCR